MGRGGEGGCLCRQISGGLRGINTLTPPTTRRPSGGPIAGTPSGPHRGTPSSGPQTRFYLPSESEWRLNKMAAGVALGAMRLAFAPGAFEFRLQAVVLFVITCVAIAQAPNPMRLTRA